MTGLPVTSLNHLKTSGQVLPFKDTLKRFSALTSSARAAEGGSDSWSSASTGRTPRMRNLLDGGREDRTAPALHKQAGIRLTDESPLDPDVTAIGVLTLLRSFRPLLRVARQGPAGFAIRPRLHPD